MSDRPSRQERFAARVGVRRLDGCEPWLGQVSARTGGGLFFDDDNRQRSAQLVRWEFAHGQLPPRASVTQRCSLPTCVRLEHLRLGRAARQVRAVVAAPTSGTGPAGTRPAGTGPAATGGRLGDVLEHSRRTRHEAEQLRRGAQDVLLRSQTVLDAAVRLARAAPDRSGPASP